MPKDISATPLEYVDINVSCATKPFVKLIMYFNCQDIIKFWEIYLSSYKLVDAMCI